MMNSESIHRQRSRCHSQSWFATVFSLVLLWMAALPQTASAHPGHHLSDAEWSHLLSSPDHLLAMLLTGAGLFLAGCWVQRRLARRLLQCTGAAVAAASLLICGLRF